MASRQNVPDQRTPMLVAQAAFGDHPSGNTHAADTRNKRFMIRDRVSRRRLLTTLTVATLIVVASSFVAWDGDVPAWERSILEFINGWPDWLEPIMWVLQQYGVFAAPVIGGLIVVANTKDLRHLVPFVAVLPLKLGIEKGIVKQLVERERPFVSTGEWVNVRGPAFEGLSFPSGHTTTAFALATLLTAFLPSRWRPLPIVWAAITGIARMYYGEHNALDVVAGAALGTAFATGLWFLFLNRMADSNRAWQQ